MPIINIQILEGRPPEKVKSLIARVGFRRTGRAEGEYSGAGDRNSEDALGNRRGSGIGKTEIKRIHQLAWRS